MTTVVNSWNEWDPLELVILGRPEGSSITAPEPGWAYHLPEAGYPIGTYGPFPDEMVARCNEQMDAFAGILESRGVHVQRPEPHPSLTDYRPVATPDWCQLNQYGINNPRDVFLVLGSEIMEATTCRRSRWFEYLNLRPLFEAYFREDPEFLWTAAPKPRLTEASYVANYYYQFREVWDDEEKLRRARQWQFQLTEAEPLWDAGDAARFGRDVFWQASATTNRAGVDWLQRYFGRQGIRVHTVHTDANTHPWHIDVSLMPLRPGLAIYNPVWKPRDEGFWQLMRQNDWDLIPAAPPTYVHRHHCTVLGQYGQRSWVSMNALSLDPETIAVEAHETAYMEQLDALGFRVIPIAYDAVIPFGGSLHCTTLDVRRRGSCQDYFPRQVSGF